MSWSGFKKAVNRAGAHVIMKTSKNTESSSDPDFDLKEQEFKNYESLINEINLEFKNLHSTINDLTSTNLAISKTLDSFYGDYNFDLNSDNLLGLQSNNNNNTNNNSINQRDGISLNYLKNSFQINQITQDSLTLPIQKTIFDPINQLIDYNNEIHKLIKKRNRKKFDYDVALNKLDKLQNDLNQLKFNNLNDNSSSSTSQLIKKQNDKLERAKLDLNSVAEIYNDLNNRLKLEIDEFIALRFSLLDPSFESFMKIQQFFYSNCNNQLNENIKIDSQSIEDFNINSIDLKLDEILIKMKSLDINNL